MEEQIKPPKVLNDEQYQFLKDNVYISEIEQLEELINR